MDSLRSCYRTTMRFPGVGLVDVIWYWTDQPLLGKETVYGSHNHSREQGWEDYDTGEPGEVWGAERKWYNGSPLIDTCCTGPQGSDAAWVGENGPNDPLFLVPMCENVSIIANLFNGRSFNGHQIYGPTVAAEWRREESLDVAYQSAVSYSPTWRRESSLAASSSTSGDYAAAWDKERQWDYTENPHVYFSPLWSQERSLATTQVTSADHAASWDQERSLDATQDASYDAATSWDQERSLTATVSEYDNIVTFDCQSLNAAGTTQGTAAAIASDSVVVTATASQNGVILPDACNRIIVENVSVSTTVNVYPPVGQKISGGTTNSPFAVSVGAVIEFARTGALQWRQRTFS